QLVARRLKERFFTRAGKRNWRAGHVLTDREHCDHQRHVLKLRLERYFSSAHAAIAWWSTPLFCPPTMNSSVCWPVCGGATIRLPISWCVAMREPCCVAFAAG